MSIKKIFTQLQRELWEYKTGFLWVPLILTLLWVVFASYVLIDHERMASNIEINITTTEEQNQTFDERGRSVNSTSTTTTETSEGLEVLASLLGSNSGNPDFLLKLVSLSLIVVNIILWINFVIVLIDYTYATLFDDRKNREILFWRSMPVSETLNVLTKLAIIMLVVPCIILILTLATGVIIVLIGGAVVGNSDQFLGATQALLIPFQLFGTSMFCLMVLLPVIAWILFASAVAKKSPFIISFAIPISIFALDQLVVKMTGINLHIKDALNAYLGMTKNLLNAFFSNSTLLFEPYIIQQGLIAVSIGCLLMMATIWLRNNRYEL